MEEIYNPVDVTELSVLFGNQMRNSIVRTKNFCRKLLLNQLLSIILTKF